MSSQLVDSGRVRCPGCNDMVLARPDGTPAAHELYVVDRKHKRDRIKPCPRVDLWAIPMGERTS